MTIPDTFVQIDISIHAPLAGSDRNHTGGTRYEHTFQSTLPLRGATVPTLEFFAHEIISIHAPLAGSDHAP